ncbi:MAG: LytTR family DNA-binding domain-containing protein [Inconstantimicrobium porci]|uniref:LytR/AlgR family response regulator transcription factor n=1 Tax=Inconstantimicrobium porci TaxID=2652291 RepID=UPI002A90FA52|nr:LytTR family DNA-binding domain-containing protein [Inconstantimicrobium porci]MDY5910637.1 LytTR family DNA-binding domain-containing protein [Inconstantimicrobium porci]
MRFVSAEAFLFEYSKDMAYDILLLDVEMREMSGIDLAKQIRAENNKVEIVFVTSHFEFIGEGYEVDALHYIVKPVSVTKMMSVLSKAAEKLAIAPASVLISCNNEMIKLYEDDILYVEAFLHYICIHTKSNEYRLKEKISNFENKLSDVFYRTHRSYLVSLRHIVKISRTTIYIDNGCEIPLARGKYDDINRAFIKHN